MCEGEERAYYDESESATLSTANEWAWWGWKTRLSVEVDN